MYVRSCFSYLSNVHLDCTDENLAKEGNLFRALTRPGNSVLRAAPSVPKFQFYVNGSPSSIRLDYHTKSSMHQKSRMNPAFPTPVSFIIAWLNPFDLESLTTGLENKRFGYLNC